jgi:aromatic-L-amino-acid/L-tryptophan decarboxylase
VGELPVLSQVEPGAIRDALPPSPPDEPEPFSAVLADLDTVLLPGLTHWQSPRFFAYFATTGSEPGVLAELLIAGLNQVGILWRTSPALQELEELTVDWLRQLLGLPDEFKGHIEDTASTGVLAAVIVARSLQPDRRVLVCSEHAHSVGEKAARLLGLELRKVPTDDEFRMRPELIEADDACAVVATIGTTGMTSVDPVPEIAERCAAAGTWLHVDAAYAGSAAILPELRHHFTGWERADSIGVNPHKWLGVPMDCSVLWTRRREDFRRAFSLVPEFLQSPDDAVNLSEVSIPLGRRFRALKLWAVLRCYGRSGLQERLREHVRLAELFESWVVAEPGWELTAPRHFSLVCFRRERSDEENERLLERVNQSGEVFLSHTRFDERYMLRLAVGNFRTTEADVRLAWDVLRREASTL